MPGRTCPSCGVFFNDTIPGYPLPMCGECLGRQASRHAWSRMTALDETDGCDKCGASREDIPGDMAIHKEWCRFEMTEGEIQIAKKQEHLHG